MNPIGKILQRAVGHSGLQRGNSLLKARRLHVELHPAFLRLADGGGIGAVTADFHWFWLRHQCPHDVHPQTKERTIDACDIDLNIQPASAELATDGNGRKVVSIRWREVAGAPSRVSTYDVEWLRRHAYTIDRTDVPPPSDVAQLIVRAADYKSAVDMADACMQQVSKRGAAYASGVLAAPWAQEWIRHRGGPEGGLGDDPAAAATTAPLIDAFQRSAARLRLTPTHFGDIEDLRVDNNTNKNTDQLGYTTFPVDMHTDQPFIEHPPKFQLLQCIRPATRGGESKLVDADAVARYLKATDASAFDQLTSVPVVFDRRQKAFESKQVHPILRLAPGGGALECVRYSYFTQAPFSVPFSRMREWYSAYSTFARLVRTEAYQYRLQLPPGDFVIYNNRLVLHAREGFEGPRWFRGVYFDPI